MRDTVGEQQPPELVELIEPEESIDSDVYVKSGKPVVSGELVELEDPIKPESPELVELIEPVLGELEDPVRPEEHGSVSVLSPTQSLPPNRGAVHSRVRNFLAHEQEGSQ